MFVRCAALRDRLNSRMKNWSTIGIDMRTAQIGTFPQFSLLDIERRSSCFTPVRV